MSVNFSEISWRNLLPADVLNIKPFGSYIRSLGKYFPLFRRILLPFLLGSSSPDADEEEGTTIADKLRIYLTLQSPVVTLCSMRFNIQKVCFLAT
jgi:hypothetical protein